MIDQDQKRDSRFATDKPVDSTKYLYLKRSADLQVSNLLNDKENCCILAPAQIGKTSLVLRLRREIERLPDTTTAYVNIKEVAGHETENFEQWLRRFIIEAERSILPRRPGEEHFTVMQVQKLTQTNQLAAFINNTFRKDFRNLYLFIDEFNILENYERFGEQFLMFLSDLRSLQLDDHNLRDNQRITLCLIGNTNVNNLLARNRNSVFKLAKLVHLGDFQPKEMEPMGLLFPPRAPSNDPSAVIKVIYDWTNGHPFLSAILGNRLLDGKAFNGKSAQQMIEKFDFASDRSVSEYLGHINDRILNSHNRTMLLSIYQQIITANPDSQKLYTSDEYQDELIVSGIVAVREVDGRKYLKVRNRIVERALGSEWLQKVRDASRASKPNLESLGEPSRVLRGNALIQQTIELTELLPRHDARRALVIAGVRQAVAEAAVGQRGEDWAARRVDEAFFTQSVAAQKIDEAAQMSQEAERRIQDADKAVSQTEGKKAELRKRESRLVTVFFAAVALISLLALMIAVRSLGNAAQSRREADAARAAAEQARQTEVRARENAEKAQGAANTALTKATEAKKQAEAEARAAAKAKEEAETTARTLAQEIEHNKSCQVAMSKSQAKLNMTKKALVTSKGVLSGVVRAADVCAMDAQRLRDMYHYNKCKHWSGGKCYDDDCEDVMRRVVKDLENLYRPLAAARPAD